jgi:hypothetical protein
MALGPIDFSLLQTQFFYRTGTNTELAGGLGSPK